MEWVETTASSVEQAKDMLLDRLGVDEQEAEFEVLEEPKPGLFGRMRGQYRVRARVAPKAQRSKDDKRRRPAKSKDRDRSRSGGGEQSGSDESASAPAAKASDAEPPVARVESDQRPPRSAAPKDSSRDTPREERPAPSAEAVEAMADEVTTFLQTFVDEFGVTGTAVVEVDEEGQLQARVDGEGLGALIGPRGGMLAALEELCRTRVQHLADGTSSPRLRLDVGGYRELRRRHLVELVTDVAERVRETGRPHVLDVVTSSDRKVVHDTAAGLDGVGTRSEGEDPNRRVAVVSE